MREKSGSADVRLFLPFHVSIDDVGCLCDYPFGLLQTLLRILDEYRNRVVLAVGQLYESDVIRSDEGSGAVPVAAAGLVADNRSRGGQRFRQPFRSRIASRHGSDDELLQGGVPEQGGG